MPSPISKSAFNDSLATNQPTKIAVSSPDRGSRMLAVKKSNRSKMVFPSKRANISRGATSAQTFNDKIDAIPRSQQSTPTSMALPARSILVFSSTHSTTGSNREIPDVQAANSSNIKNSVPNKSE